MYHVLEGPTIVPGWENMGQEMKVGCTQDSPILNSRVAQRFPSVWRDMMSIYVSYRTPNLLSLYILWWTRARRRKTRHQAHMLL